MQNLCSERGNSYFKNHILVEWPATNWLNLRKWCGFEKPNHYYYIILFKMWPNNRFSKAKSTFIFIKTLSDDLLVQMAYLWTTNKGFAPSKGIREGLGFWIPYGGFLIPVTGFQSLSVKLGFWFPRLAFKWEYRFLKLYSGFHKHFFSGFQIPQTKISWIPKSSCPYKKIALHQPQGVQHHRFYLWRLLSPNKRGFPLFLRLFL